MPPSALGAGWTSRYFSTLTKSNGGFQFLNGDGAIEVFADAEDIVERGGVLRNLGTFQEISKREGRYIITMWDVDDGEIERYVFTQGAPGEAWPLTSIEDDTGQGLDMLHDASGRLRGIRQRVEGRTLRLEYSPDNKIISVSLAAANQTQVLVRYEYDQAGRLVAAFDALRNADRYEYDSRGRLAREIAMDGGVFYFRYDAKGRCLKTSGLDHYDEKTLRYLDAIRCTEVTDSLGNVTRYYWLPSGQVTKEVNPVGGSHETVYDDQSRIVAQIDPNGNATKYEYDEQGNRSKVIDALGNTWALQYNDNHQAVLLEAPNGAVCKRFYDQGGRLVQTIDPHGGVWGLVWDSNSNLVASTSPTGATRRWRYVDGVLAEAIDAEGNRTTFSYDPAGRVIERIGPVGDVTRFVYDAVGNPIRLTYADGSSINIQYDAAGNLASYTDANGYTTSYRYGSCDRLLERINPLGETVRYNWGTEPQRLTSVINEKGEVFTFDHDAVGRVVKEVGFDGRQFSYEYDLADNPIAQINGAGERVSKRYDALNRVVAEILPDGSQTRFTFDSIGELIAGVNADCPLTFERDLIGAITREIQNDDWVATTYDGDGNATRIESSQGLDIRQGHDGNGRLRQLATQGGDTIAIRRNGYGAEIERHLPGGLTLEQSYDRVGNLARQQLHRYAEPSVADRGQAATRGVSPLVHRTFQFDRNATLASLTDGVWGRTVFQRDPAERILAAVREIGPSETFAYDESGNIVRRTRNGASEEFVYGPGERLLRRGDTSYEYDANGRRIARVDGASTVSPRVWRYEWDAKDQLRAVVTPDGDTWRYAYDALGRRISKIGPGKKERFVWYGNEPLHHIQNTGGAATWIFDEESFAPLCKLEGGRCYSVVVDHTGTPRELVDSAGQIAWSARPATWGSALAISNRATDCQIRLPGQWADDESGLHYNRFRFYDPETGQYLSQDPIGLDGGHHLYQYAQDPEQYFDPFGLWNRRRNNGQFAAKPGPKPQPSAHGNTRDSNKQAVLYAMYDKNGKFQKWGITQETGDPSKRYAGKKLPKGWSVVPIDKGKRSAMLKLESELERKKPGPKNKVSWAGKGKGEKLSKRAAAACAKAGV